MKYVVLQTGIWATSAQSIQNILSPEGWGWSKDLNSLKIVWMTLPEAASACELIKCIANLLEVVIDVSALKGYPVQNYAIVTVKSSHNTTELMPYFIHYFAYLFILYESFKGVSSSCPHVNCGCSSRWFYHYHTNESPYKILRFCPLRIDFMLFFP